MIKYTSLLFLLVCGPCPAMVPSSPDSHEGFFAELRPLVSDNLDQEPQSSSEPLRADQWQTQDDSPNPVLSCSPGKMNPESLLLPKADLPKACPKAKKGHAGPSSHTEKPQKTKIHKTYLCQDCNTSFESRVKLKSHAALHIKHSRPFACPHRSCPYGTRTKQLLDRHLRKFHKDQNDTRSAEKIRARAAAQAAALVPLIQERLIAQKTSRPKKRASVDIPRDESVKFQRSCPHGCGLTFSSAKEYVEHGIACAPSTPKETHLTPASFRAAPSLPELVKNFKNFQPAAHGGLQ